MLHDGLVDIAHALGEQRTSASVSFSCVSIFTFLILFCTYDVVLQMDGSTIKGNQRMLMLSQRFLLRLVGHDQSTMMT